MAEYKIETLFLGFEIYWLICGGAWLFFDFLKYSVEAPGLLKIHSISNILWRLNPPKTNFPIISPNSNRKISQFLTSPTMDFNSGGIYFHFPYIDSDIIEKIDLNKSRKKENNLFENSFNFLRDSSVHEVYRAAFVYLHNTSVFVAAV